MRAAQLPCASGNGDGSVRRLIRCCVLPGMLALTLGGCAPAGPDPVTVFAAASLREVLESVATDVHEQTGIQLRFSFAASSTLARQIEAGAPADIFISAHARWMDRLDASGHIDHTSRAAPFGNRLVLIAPVQESVSAMILEEAVASLSTRRRLALGDPAHVPAGIYARQALQAAGLWRDNPDHYAFTDNVRAALALVARSETPFGIVYATDTRVESAVEVVTRIDGRLHDAIVYHFATVTGSRSPGTAKVYAALTGGAAVAQFVDAGFVVR